jgi:hypothetical protein
VLPAAPPAWWISQPSTRRNKRSDQILEIFYSHDSKRILQISGSKD